MSTFTVVLLCAGCAQQGPTGKGPQFAPAPVPARAAQPTTPPAHGAAIQPTRPASPATATPAPPAPARYPVVTPANSTTGRVAAVNVNLRFVVLDFALNPMPALGQRLNVYRQGQKVGEVTVSGPVRNSNVVADLVVGEAQVGDQVRAD